MSIARDRLESLVAVIDMGSFEAAARALSVTPSAISQRIRSLESQVGQVLVTRATPCAATAVGQVLVRLGRLQALLEHEAMAEISGGQRAVADLHLAVNADSLATWFVDVLHAASAWPDVTLRLTVADQERTGPMLRSGRVMAAVTADHKPVQGCSSEPLGVMRYVAVATPDLLARGRTADGSPDYARMPVVHFDDNDQMQRRLLAGRTPAAQPAYHVVPSSEGFVAAIRAGLGWGAIPEDQLGDALGGGELVALHPTMFEDVVLHWQAWRIESALLTRVTVAVREASARLRQGRQSR